ncbi:MAG: HEAT repeat domain-containing protein, partial [Planctomycetota bacterium]
MMKSFFFVLVFLCLNGVLLAQDYKKEFEGLWNTGDFEKQGQAFLSLGNVNDAKSAKLMLDYLKIVETLQLGHEQKINKKASEGDKFEDGDKNKVPVLVELVKMRDQMAEYDFILEKAAIGISLFKDPQAIKVLASEAPKFKSVMVKMAIMKALGKVDGKEALDLLIKSLKDKSPQVRQIALESLKTKIPAEAFEPILPLISDKVWQVRSAAVETLAKYDNPNSIKPLIDQLKEEQGRVSEDIEKTLNVLTGESHEGNYHAWLARYNTEKEKWMQGIKKEKPKEVEVPTINNPLRGSKKYYNDIQSRQESTQEKPKDGGT